MSVPAYRRNESVVQYVDTARELEIYTIRYCSKFPKRFMFLITQHIVELAQSVYDNANSANTMYPLTDTDKEMRINFFTKAICDVKCLAAQVDLAKAMITHFETGAGQNCKTKAIEPKVWEKWAVMMKSELNLLKSARKALHDKYKKEQ